MSIMFNQISINEEMLPIYIYIYIYILCLCVGLGRIFSGKHILWKMTDKDLELFFFY